jgi:solute carrier family 34 (sodium-dependent phosphate cotransporter)
LPLKFLALSTQIIQIIQRTIIILLALFFFLLCVDLLSNGFKYLGKDVANSLIVATSNPFIGLFVGLLITAIIQSSSTTTSMIVAFVAAGLVEISNAVPMIIGANIGTTITSTLIAVGFINKHKEFRKAIAAGVIHDFFNIVIVLLLFPLEYFYGIISKSAVWLAHLVHGGEDPSGVTGTAKPFLSSAELVAGIMDVFPFPIVFILISFILLLISIKLLSKFIYEIVSGGSADGLKRYFFGRSTNSFLWGFLLTAGVLSSSVTTSLIVPFAATGKVKLNKALHFILGANIGTTITAIVAGLFRSEAALAIAFAHLVFNVIGVSIFLVFPWLKRWLRKLAESFARYTSRYKMVGFIYILLTFFLIPFSLIYLYDDKGTDQAQSTPTELLIDEPVDD